MAGQLVATFTAETKEPVHVKVESVSDSDDVYYEVYVDGGLMASGEDSSQHRSLLGALQAAAHEVLIAYRAAQQEGM